MAEYIDKEALTIEILGLTIVDSYVAAYADAVLNRIQNAKPADVAPVRKGRWIMRGGKFRCSECDARANWKKEGGTGGFSYEYEQVKSHYCHNCGAKMDADN